MDGNCDALQRELRQLSDADLRDFLNHYHDANARAYDWKLWAAAYVLNGGCSDDAFSDFRASLISRGRVAFESALADPDSLADTEPGQELFYEGYDYAVHEVATARWGELPPPAKPFPKKPSGQDWTEEDLPRLLPRLAGDADAPVSPATPATFSTNQPASFAEWKKIPIPFNRIVDTFCFSMTWTLPDAAAKFAEFRGAAERSGLDEPGMKAGFRQGLKERFAYHERHERLIDDALRARGFPTITELHVHQTKILEGMLQKRVVTTSLQFDLAQRVLASSIPLSGDERAALTSAVAGYKPKRSALFDDLSGDDANEE